MGELGGPPCEILTTVQPCMITLVTRCGATVSGHPRHCMVASCAWYSWYASLHLGISNMRLNSVPLLASVTGHQ